nr:replication initiation protein [Campylobacter cuniculorum]
MNYTDLKKDFTQLKFDDIQRMKSAYSIRIYNMLVCELKQNRQSLRINLSVLQNILEVPREYKHFNQKVLKQTAKDINGKSHIILLEIKTHKTGRKVTELEFIFDYKNNDRCIREEKVL